MRRCVQVCEPHAGASVWATASMGDSFVEVLSAGRDGSIVATAVHSGQRRTIVPSECIVPEPPQSDEEGAARRLLAPLALATSDQSVWVSTTASSLQEWRLPPVDTAAPTAMPRALRNVTGLPGLIRHAVMNDRRHVATQDDTGMVEVWDVTRGCCVQSAGVVGFKEFDEVAAKLADLDKTRPIALMETIGKLYERVIVNRVTGRIVHHGMIDASQYGAMPEAGVAAPVRMTAEVIEDAVANDKELHLAMLDLKKAFDTYEKSDSSDEKKAFGDVYTATMGGLVTLKSTFSQWVDISTLKNKQMADENLKLMAFMKQ